MASITARPAARVDFGAAGRLERKCLIAGIDPAFVRHVVRLHPAGFREIHHERFVNNCYFDSAGLVFFWDAVQGHSRRLKIRVRWYGALFGLVTEPILECKAKHDSIGTKQGFPMPAFTLDRHSELSVLRAWFRNVEMPPRVSHLAGALRPTLVNRYSRQYFISADRRFRLTIDTGCEFYATGRRLRAGRVVLDDVTTIVELKYALDDDDDAAIILNDLPFRVTKSSKYVTGLERLGFRA